jgi:hypothetical protein
MPRGLAVHGVFVAISAFPLLPPPGASATPEGSTESNDGFSGGAEQEGLRYQTYIKSLPHETLVLRDKRKVG